MSSECNVCGLQAHADVKPLTRPYQRDRTGLNAVLAKVRSAIVLPISPCKSSYLIVKGMMRSLANVHCELFVPPPNGVVLFKDAS